MGQRGPQLDHGRRQHLQVEGLRGQLRESKDSSTVDRATSADCGERKVIATTLQEILHEEVENEEWWIQEVYWKDLEWRHIQLILDESGGESERFRLLAKILDHIAEVELMEGTFVPYGNQFADSDFL